MNYNMNDDKDKNPNREGGNQEKSQRGGGGQQGQGSEESNS